MANLTNLNNKFLVTTGGNVGIGTTSPATKLEVYGNVQNNTTSIANSAAYIRGADVGIAIGQSASSPYGTWVQSQRNSDGVAFPLLLNPSGSNVGIGTTSPSANLHVQNASTATLKVITTGVADASVNIQGYDAGVHIGDATNGLRWAIWNDGQSTSSSLKFGSYALGTWYNDSSQVVTMTSDGKVGIGTTSPDYKLEVQGVISSADSGLQKSTFANVGNDLVLTANADATNVTANILFKSSGSGGAAISEKMRLTSGGDLCVGVTTALGKIHMHNSGTSYLHISNDTTGSGAGSGTDIGVFTGQSDLQINNREAASVIISTSDTPRLTINSSGNVVLGTTNGEINFSSGNGYVQTTTGSTSLVFGVNSAEKMRIHSSGNVGIGTTSPETKLEVRGSIASGTGTAPTQLTYDTSGLIRAFVHNFSEEKNTASARNVTFVDVSGLGNFHQAMFYVQYGTRLQSVSDATTGAVVRTYGVNRFNGGTLQVTETNAIAGSSNSVTHALITVEIVSNTQYRLRVEFSSTLGPSSFVTGLINGFAVGDSFPTITFAEGAAGL